MLLTLLAACMHAHAAAAGLALDVRCAGAAETACAQTSMATPQVPSLLTCRQQPAWQQAVLTPATCTGGKLVGKIIVTQDNAVDQSVYTVGFAGKPRH